MSLDFQSFVLETSIVRMHATDKKIDAAYVGNEMAKNHVSVKTISVSDVPKTILTICQIFAIKLYNSN